LLQSFGVIACFHVVTPFWEFILIRKLVIASLFASAAAAAPLLSRADQSAPNEKQMAPLQYLIGTWHCDWKSQKRTGSEDQIFQPALGGAWLEEREVVKVNGTQMVASIHYTGYDPRSKSYIHMGPDADGSYEVAHSADTELWDCAGGTFVHHKISETERTMTESYRSGTATVQISMTCLKNV
jgi:hypothetical protein